MTATEDYAGSVVGVQEWLAGVGPRESSIHIARTHVFAETSTDTDYICSTISKDVFFGVPTRTREGNVIPEGAVLTTYDKVRGYYEGRAGSYVVLASAQLKSLGTDWYLFNESAATLRGTGMIGDVDTTGREWIVNSAVLFPTAPDGIRGEICATRHPFVDVVKGDLVQPPPADGPKHLSMRELAHTALLDRLLTALQRRDLAGVQSCLRPRHTMAIRFDDADGRPSVATSERADGAAGHLCAMLGEADDVTLLVRLATEWYVFAEFLAKMPSGVRRLAVILPTDDGLFSSAFGYGKEESL